MNTIAADDSQSETSTGTLPSLHTLVWRSLTAFRALHLALALGIAAATAVILGALVVGDSVRGSLQQIIVQRLGSVHSVMISQRFFASQLLSPESTEPLDGYRLLPAILLPSSAAELKHSTGLRRAANVQVLGITADFWPLTSADKRLQNLQLGADEVALSQALATELDAKVGDELTIRLPKGTGVPADSPLGRRDDASASLPRQRVAAILPAETVADIDFRASQLPTRNVFVPVAALQDALEQPQRVNAGLLVATTAAAELNSQTLDDAQRVCDQLNARITPHLGDYGVKLTRHTRVFPDQSIGEQQPADSTAPPQTVFDYYQISSDQLIMDNLTMSVLLEELQIPSYKLEPARVLSYLVNEIRAITPQNIATSKVATYSIVTGLENWERSLPVTKTVNDMWREMPNTCGISPWLAEQLDIQPGSTIRLSFFEPETVEGREVETTIDLVVNAIVDMAAPEKGYVRNRPAIFAQPPTKANDPGFTPVVPGITDQDTISDWDLPFKLTRDIPKADDDYWRDYRLTPKIFVRYPLAVRNFGSRFGNTTGIRIEASQLAAAGLDEPKLIKIIDAALLRAKAGLGLQLLPLRATQLKSAAGTTPFDGLFLALSFFVIVAALMLVALLIRLSIEQRSTQWGILMATGFQPRRVRSLLLLESSWVMALGIVLGCLGGLGYAWLMIAGLETWWVGAISGSFLSYHVTLKSLLVGAAIGGGTSLATIWWSLRRLQNSTTLGLLRGRWESLKLSSDATAKASMAVAGFLFFGALGLLILGFTLTGMAQAGAFFGCGMLLVSASLAAIIFLLSQPESSPTSTSAQDSSRSKSTSTGPTAKVAAFSAGLWSLAWSTSRRNIWRSVLTIGLLAVASFLIASMSVFQIAPALQGSGGFELIGESSLPIYRDPGTVISREETLSAGDFDTLRSVNIISFRERPGEDASCNNLFQVAQPTILGVPTALHQHQRSIPEDQRFQWAAVSPHFESPWEALSQVGTGTENDPIPVVLDMNTAAWSLHQGASIDAITKLQLEDRVLYFRTVGLLSNSIMQGKLLISEYNFSQLFPEISGFKYFLIHDHEKDPQAISAAMENGWSDQGLDVTPSAEVLTKLLAVQNTYISAFQAIGALGLLLGTIGLAIVQVRSVIERRRELALMQAIGFSRSRLSALLLTESSVLLIGGLLIGVASAMVALVPYMLTNSTSTDAVKPLLMLVIVMAVGLGASSIAVFVALRQPLLKNIV